jgi:phospholipid/cholesterol/gamma-HCH transport system permease protein
MAVTAPRLDADEPPAPRVRRPARGTALVEELGAIVEFSLFALASVRGTFRYFSEVLSQTSLLVRKSLPVICLMTALIGVADSLFGIYFLRSAGAADYAGLFTGITIPRAAVTVMFGYIFAAKVGGGLVAEIGSMRISEELDALETEGVDPMQYAVGTRLVATLLFMPIAAIAGLAACNLGAYVNVVYVVGEVSSSGFSRFNWGLQTISDQLYSLLQLTMIGVTITLVSCYYGYKATGGPAGVGRAVARSMVINLVAIHLIASVMTTFIYGTDPKLPIGG